MTTGSCKQKFVFFFEPALAKKKGRGLGGEVPFRVYLSDLGIESRFEGSVAGLGREYLRVGGKETGVQPVQRKRERPWGQGATSN